MEDAIEGVSAGHIRLRRNSPVGPLDVGYEPDPGDSTATPGVDYAPLPGQVSFPDGADTADIVIDPLGPYADPDETPYETVGLQLTWAGKPGQPAQPLPAPVPAQAGIVQPAAGNRPPEFDCDPLKAEFGPDPEPDPDVFDFEVGYGLGGYQLVGTVKAFDPDGDQLKYSFTNGDAGGLLKLDGATGAITVEGQHFPTTAATYLYSAADGTIYLSSCSGGMP